MNILNVEVIKMIEHIETLNQQSNISTMQINTLTLERNSVLVIRVDKNGGYDYSELEVFQRRAEEIFPSHKVLVCYDDLDFMVIHDKGYKAERLDNLNGGSSNYY